MNTLSKSNTLPQNWTCLKKDQPKLRIVDAAVELGVSEGELLASQCGDTATRLRPAWPEFFSKLNSLGPVMALSRNQSAVHERVGVYDNIRITNSMGLVLNRDIDLRIFFSRWKYLFAADVDNALGTLKSYQVFDSSGKAIHKIYLKSQSNFNAYTQIISDFISDDQSASMKISSAPTITIQDSENKIAATMASQLKTEWRSLRDPHQFFPMLKRLGLTRRQALHLVGQNMARPLPADALSNCLRLASGQEVPIMVFVSNPGIVQIHTGPIVNVKTNQNWINVIDKEFNLHVKKEDIAEIWAVKKPADGGVVNSLEVFDIDGNLIVQIFGERKPGQLERKSWLRLVQSL